MFLPSKKSMERRLRGHPEACYATLAHELTHWTKHKSRLDREFGRKRWGDEGYTREDLVAELGATFLCADLSLAPHPTNGAVAPSSHPAVSASSSGVRLSRTRAW
ncbi:zincin-like metallopeptidase domain-containing protein [Aquibaculum sediminis]|uniref:zincin-like metallopeptidase domain-containing protein n=1 Tax=Aquibaculum sediminis TaxID=3231907 RepID=UPI003451AEBE